MIRITPDQNRILPLYLFYYLSNERAKKAHILKYVTQSTISGINQSGVKLLEILIPPLPLQQKFVRIVQNYERLRAQQRESARQAEHLFQSLLQRAFRGELTINY
jgi:type I restriction enzyme S subunit